MPIQHRSFVSQDYISHRKWHAVKAPEYYT